MYRAYFGISYRQACGVRTGEAQSTSGLFCVMAVGVEQSQRYFASLGRVAEMISLLPLVWQSRAGGRYNWQLVSGRELSTRSESPGYVSAMRLPLAN